MARSWNQTEKSYSQIKRESNGVYCRVVSNMVYLLGGLFMVVVDHNPLIYLYNGQNGPAQDETQGVQVQNEMGTWREESLQLLVETPSRRRGDQQGR